MEEEEEAVMDCAVEGGFVSELTTHTQDESTAPYIPSETHADTRTHTSHYHMHKQTQILTDT